jgi:hypothetical protein
MTYKLLIDCQEAAANAIREDVASMITGDEKQEAYNPS